MTTDKTLDGARIVLAIASLLGMLACAAQAALVTEHGHHRRSTPSPRMRRWGYRLLGMVLIVISVELTARI